MTISALFAEIESPTFSAKANFASSFRLFERIISNENVVQAFLEEIKDNLSVADFVFARIQRLSKVDQNFEFENSTDVAFATYLWILNRNSPSVGKIAAKEVLNECPRIWWAKQLARKILAASVNVDTEISIVSPYAENIVPETDNIWGSGVAVIIAGPHTYSSDIAYNVPYLSVKNFWDHVSPTLQNVDVNILAAKPVSFVFADQDQIAAELKMPTLMLAGHSARKSQEPQPSLPPEDITSIKWVD